MEKSSGRNLFLGFLTLALIVSCFLLALSQSAVSPWSHAGTVSVNWDRFDLQLTAAGRAGHLVIRGEKGGCQVPVGRYEAYQLTLITKDEKGNEWRMGRESVRQPFVVEEDKTIEISVKPPFVASVKASRYRTEPGQTVELSLEILDSQGNRFSPPQSFQLERTGAPASFAVFDSTEKEIEKHDFQFG